VALSRKETCNLRHHTHLAGTPMAMSGGMLDTDALINHAVKIFKARLASDGVCDGVCVYRCAGSHLQKLCNDVLV